MGGAVLTAPKLFFHTVTVWKSGYRELYRAATAASHLLASPRPWCPVWLQRSNVSVSSLLRHSAHFVICWQNSLWICFCPPPSTCLLFCHSVEVNCSSGYVTDRMVGKQRQQKESWGDLQAAGARRPLASYLCEGLKWQTAHIIIFLASAFPLFPLFSSFLSFAPLRYICCLRDKSKTTMNYHLCFQCTCWMFDAFYSSTVKINVLHQSYLVLCLPKSVEQASTSSTQKWSIKPKSAVRRPKKLLMLNRKHLPHWWC